MGKKRSFRAKDSEDAGPNMDVGSSRKRIRSYEDVADSDDEFHDGRDRILLDEAPEVKRRRKIEEQEAFLQPSDEEVLSYSEDDEDEEDLDDDESDDNARAKARMSVTNGDLSDDEQSEDDDEEMEGGGTGWGTSKSDLYGADAIETEEQALEEEREALRLQKRQLQAMSAADYGFDEADWQGGDAEDMEDASGENVVVEVLPQLQISDTITAAQRSQILKSRYPEFEPLSQELLRMQEISSSLRESDETGNPTLVTKLLAASAYVGALTMYFTLLTSPAWDGSQGVVAMSASGLRDHPVMDSLVSCRALWQKVEHLPLDSGALEQELSAAEDLSDELSDEGLSHDATILQTKSQTLSRAQRHAIAAQEAANARRAERMQRTKTDLADLDELLRPAARSKHNRKEIARSNGDDSDLGDEVPLTAAQAADKANRKKSLRFYTSQIAQKANKRGASGRNAGGDEDIPYRERLRDRQIRLNAEAEKRGQHRASAGDDLGGESDEDDARQAQQIRGEVDEDDYYDIVATRTAKKKDDKAALAEAQKQAALQGGHVVVAGDTVGADGKRKISYIIEKNKGLTPHRKKDVRNPRVKKRKKFEEKKKKLASIKPVYKGGEGRGGYAGELTGIKKGLVKSVKL